MSPDEEVGARRLARASSAILPQPFPGAILPFHRAALWTAPATCPRVNTSHSPPSKRRTAGDGQSHHCRHRAMGPTHPEAPTYLPSAPARRSCTCCPISQRRTSRLALRLVAAIRRTTFPRISTTSTTTTHSRTTSTTTSTSHGTSPATRATRASRTMATSSMVGPPPRLERTPRRRALRHPSSGHGRVASVPCGHPGLTTRLSL